MHRTAKILIGIVSLVLLVPVIAYSQDLNSELLDAAKQRDTATVKALLAKGADINAKDKEGGTALMQAAVRGHTEIVRTLLAMGADVNAKAESGITALIFAVIMGHDYTIKALLFHGADVNAKTKDGMSALMFAVDKGDPEILRLLRGAPQVQKKGISQEEVVKQIIVLTIGSARQKYNACIQLREMGTKATPAIPTLIDALVDRTQVEVHVSGPPPLSTGSGFTVIGSGSVFGFITVGKEAAKSLQVITGKDFGEDQAKWQKWWEENKEQYK